MEIAFNQPQVAAQTRALAHRNIHIGTSSWKYPGWQGLLYDTERYRWRGHFSESRFNRTCLNEYAETFPSVCVDGAYYQFPSEKYLVSLSEQTPPHFKFSFKVTDAITIKRFPKLPRHGDRGGQNNPHFLDNGVFTRQFLAPCEAIRPKVGLLIFEFSKFYPRDFERGRHFVDALDRFFSKLPREWHYGVEIRNANFLQEEYFTMLAAHQVAHVYNSWDAMPGIDEQIEKAGDALGTTPIGARLLLKPGRSYQTAVDQFQPYKHLQEIVPSARDASAQLIKKALQQKVPLYLYGNNRLEGCSPHTLQAILNQLPQWVWEKLDLTDTEIGDSTSPSRTTGLFDQLENHPQ